MLAYNATIMGDYSLPTERAASVKGQPRSSSPVGRTSHGCETARALADAFPDGQTGTREGQGHNVDPAVLALALVKFF